MLFSRWSPREVGVVKILLVIGICVVASEEPLPAYKVIQTAWGDVDIKDNDWAEARSIAVNSWTPRLTKSSPRLGEAGVASLDDKASYRLHTTPKQRQVDALNPIKCGHTNHLWDKLSDMHHCHNQEQSGLRKNSRRSNRILEELASSQAQVVMIDCLSRPRNKIRERWLCEGTILHEDLVLTSSQCLPFDIAGCTVIAGWPASVLSDKNVQIRQARGFCRLDGFHQDPTWGSFSDAAVIHLRSPLDLSANRTSGRAATACLDANFLPDEGTDCFMAYLDPRSETRRKGRRNPRDSRNRMREAQGAPDLVATRLSEDSCEGASDHMLITRTCHQRKGPALTKTGVDRGTPCTHNHGAGLYCLRRCLDGQEDQSVKLMLVGQYIFTMKQRAGNPSSRRKRGISNFNWSKMTLRPFVKPTREPYIMPSIKPYIIPTIRPIFIPTRRPPEKPTTQLPTEVLTEPPTEVPTEVPTESPIEVITETPIEVPTEPPTKIPEETPTRKPTHHPTNKPIQHPTERPTERPSQKPTKPSVEEATEDYDYSDREEQEDELSSLANLDWCPSSQNSHLYFSSVRKLFEPLQDLISTCYIPTTEL